MPACCGVPDGPCPYNYKVRVVFFRYAELDLCAYCEQIRREINGDWISEDLIKECNVIVKQKVQGNGVKSQDAGTSLEPVTEDTTVKSHLSGTLQDTHVLIEPVLSYMVYALQSGTVENVKLATVRYFATEQISEAKDSLWAHCNNDIIGKKQRINDTNSRSVSEAHISDIITAWGKLENKDSLPIVVINALSFGNDSKIPLRRVQQHNTSGSIK